MKAVRSVLAALVLLSPAAASAQSSPVPAPSPSAAATATAADPGAERIKAIFTVQHIPADWFTPEFLAQVPTAKLEDIVAQFKFGLGPLRSVKKSTEPNEAQFPAPWGRYLSTFKEGYDDMYISFDAAGKVNGLFFRTPRTH